MCDPLFLDNEMASLSIGPKRAVESDDPESKRKALESSIVVSVSSTGIEPGETVTMTYSKSLYNASFLLVSGRVLPSFDEHRKATGKEDEFFSELYAQIKHRPGIASVDDAKTWFLTNAVDKIVFARLGPKPESNMYVTQSSDALITFKTLQVVKPGSKAKQDLIDEANISRLLVSPLPIQPYDALLLFTETSASTANTHRRRLVFLTKYWKITGSTVVAPPSLPSSSASSAATPATLLVFDMSSFPPVLETTIPSADSGYIRREEGLEGNKSVVYIRPPVSSDVLSGAIDWPVIYTQYAIAVTTPLDEPTARGIFDVLNALNQGVLKSLMQKIIRFAPGSVDMLNGSVFGAIHVLVLTCLVVITKSQYNPDVGKPESGLHALFKRLAIVCFEDAWPGKLVVDHYMRVQLWMLLMCIVIDSDPNYRLPLSSLALVLATAQDAYRSNYCWNWKVTDDSVKHHTTVPPPNTLTFAGTMCSYLLDTFVFGMPFDYEMVKSIATMKDRRPWRLSEFVPHQSDEVKESRDNVVMPISHALDQHTVPQIVYLFPRRSDARVHIFSNMSTPATPFAPIFQEMFRRVSGLNPRRNLLIIDWPDDRPSAYLRRATAIGEPEFENAVVIAQRTMFRIILQHQQPPTAIVPTGTLSMTLSYPDEWIAYAFSTRYIDFEGTRYVYNVSPADPTELRVAVDLKRSASAKDKSAAAAGLVSTVRDEAVIRRVSAAITRQLIATGLPVVAGVFDDSAHRLGVALDENGAMTFDIDGVPWDERKNYQREIPAYTAAFNFSPTGDDIVRRAYETRVDAWRGDMTLLATIRKAVYAIGISSSALLDAIAQLRSFATEIEFARPGRDGGSSGTSGDFPSHMQYEVCQVFIVIAAHCSLIVAPVFDKTQKRVRVEAFTTDRQLLGLRHLVADALEPGLRDRSTLANDATFDEAMRSGTRLQLCSDERFNVLIADMKTNWIGSGASPLWLHQQQSIEELLRRINYMSRRHQFLVLPPGGGKTDIACAVFRGLLTMNNTLSMLFATTKSARQAVNDLAVRVFGESRVTFYKSSSQVAGIRKLDPGHVYVIDHDVLRTTNEWFKSHMFHTFFIVDEVHMATGATQRTGSMLALARISYSSLSMTGTPLRSSRDQDGLRAWIQLGTRFPCNDEKSFFTALADVVQYPMYNDDAGVYRNIRTIDISIDATIGATDAEIAAVKSNLPVRMGGTSQSTNFSMALFMASYKASLELCTRRIVQTALRKVADGRRPLIFSQNHMHSREIAELLRHHIDEERMYIHAIGADVAGLNVPSNYQIAIMPLSVNTGYSAVHFNVRIRGVYPSNEASRAQADGRLARPGQLVEPVELITIHAGITTLMLEHHIDARNFNRMLEELNNKMRV